MLILNVAEKPSMARQLTFLLAGNDTNNIPSKSKYCKNVEFCCTFRQRQCTMIMTSVLGHVKEMDFAPEYRDWNQVSPLELFAAPIQKQVTEGMREVVANLRELAMRADYLVIWTDCDREGEYIGAEIEEICTSVNRRIVPLRARYSSMVRFEILKAFESSSPLDRKLVDAADLRSELDLRTGAAFTRLQTLRLRNSVKLEKSNCISYGSCQFPTLGFVVEQYLRILNFKAESFWSIKVDLETTNKNSESFSWERGRLFDRPIVYLLYSRIQNQHDATVVDVKEKRVQKWRPIPLRTVDLQKMASKYLKISSDQVMKIAEKLYNEGYISYPRTETEVFDPKMDLKALIEKHLDNPIWGNYSTSLLNEGKFRKPRNGKNDDKAHPPIHPLKDGKTLTGSEFRVFEFITRRFLACCSEDAIGDERTIRIKVNNEGFVVKGLKIRELNYLEVYPYEKWAEKSIGDFNIGSVHRIKNIELLNGETSPPNLLRESDLISSMDKNGIGTDATIHEHIKKIIDRNYVVKLKDSRFLPTNLGLSLVVGYDKIGLEDSLSKPKLRASLEASLRDICEGRRTKEEVSLIITNKFKQAFCQVDQRFQVLIETITNAGVLFDPVIIPNEKVCHRKEPKPKQNNQKRSRDTSISSSDKTPICKCGVSCALKTVLKEGPNKGKRFFVCSKGSDNCCNFFEWVDNGDAQAQVRGASAKTKKVMERGTDKFNHNQKCECSLIAVRGVANTAQNRGRIFYSCPKTTRKCKFFLWQDD